MNFIKDLSIDKIQNLAEDAFNQAKPKTEVEARMCEVLSHKNWGASGSLMNEIARDTYDMERFQVVSSLMWDGLENQRPAAWKVVFKSLNLLDHLIKNGAERCVDDARNHSHLLRSLGQFNYYEGTIDRGLGVREKSKQVLEILCDDERVREERQRARKLREKFGNFNKGASGMGSDGNSGGGGGAGAYGKQDSWNSNSGGGGYGEGGIYDNDKAYSGRYGNSSSTASAATPTFAAVPGEKKKPKKKKKKQQTAAKLEPVAAPAAPVLDLLGFDDAPAPAPATGGNADFGDFQGSSAPTPTGASDTFAEFDQIRSAKAQGRDLFAAAPAAATPVQQQPASFDAFGNNNAGGANNNMMNNNMMNNNMVNNNMMNNNMVNNNMVNNNMMNNNMMNNNMTNNNMNNNMAAMGNTFNNMSVGTGTPAGGMQQPAMAASNDDDFGDFEDANATSFSSPTKTSSDPMAGLINLDSLSKNPSTKMTMNSPVAIGAAAAQYQQDVQNGVQSSAPFVVSAGGSGAISSMMGPAPPQQQTGSNFSMNSQASRGSSGMPMNPQMQQQQQQQFNMNQGMQNQGMQGGYMMGGNPQMQGGYMMGGMQGGMTNTNMNQMGGQQQQMNQTNTQMNGGMGMQGGMNQMGGMQGGMNHMGGQMMGNMDMQGGMGGQQHTMR